MFCEMWKQKRRNSKMHPSSTFTNAKGIANPATTKEESLLCIAVMVLAMLLLYRLTEHLDHDLLPECQCGFRKEIGIINIIFVARQMQEKCQEQNVQLYTTVMDLTKAFDTVSPEGL
ncbi:hypothetical protein CHS0354_016666 [Potamilus streckersoni]|uniref:Reverse transcriptase domain-containing protein n=1 Tax=Potamilus streckersoni TaxID=2493646 RepID=A0AAE0THI7_9BIVA|nr:hypothetical protein CHS0354_016666 [Potamilus streckersoni]